MQATIAAWLMATLTPSAAMVALVQTASTAPSLLFGLVAGALADIVDRRRLLLVSQTILALFSALLAIGIQLGMASVTLLYLFAILTAAASAIDMPTRQAFIPVLVPRERLANALTLNVLAFNVAAVVGPAVGGLVIGYLGVAAAYWIDAASFFAVVGALVVMRTRVPAINPARRGLAALIDGLHFVHQRPILWQLMLVDFFAVLFASRFGLLPVFAESVLKIGAQGLGFLYAAVSFGAVLGSILFAFVPQPRRPGRLVVLTVLGYGVVLAAFGLARSVLVAMALLAASGALDAVSSALRQTARQLATPDRLRGRVGALSSVFAIGGPRLGDFQAGVLASLFGAGNAMIIGGTACALMAVSARWWAHPLWRYHGEELHHAEDEEELVLTPSPSPAGRGETGR
jgi:predicted MFS family arabinose efflux permease